MPPREIYMWLGEPSETEVCSFEILKFGELWDVITLKRVIKEKKKIQALCQTFLTDPD